MTADRPGPGAHLSTDNPYHAPAGKGGGTLLDRSPLQIGFLMVLGGLLATHHLTGDDMYLDKARDLADRVLPAFDTPAGLPLTLVNLAQRVGVADPENKGMVSTAEVSTLQLEFKYLSALLDEDVYWKKAEQVMHRVRKAHLSTGLASIFMR